MTPSDIQSLASAVYGARWQSQLSRDMGVALRTVQRWARDGIEKTATAEGVRRFLEERRVARMAPPPEGTTAEDDRDDACRDAIEPPITAILAAAQDVGWHEGESLVAMLAAIIDRMRRSAGAPAAIATLRSAIEAVKSDGGP
jgi:hypothetical protein